MYAFPNSQPSTLLTTGPHYHTKTAFRNRKRNSSCSSRTTVLSAWLVHRTSDFNRTFCYYHAAKKRYTYIRIICSQHSGASNHKRLLGFVLRNCVVAPSSGNSLFVRLNFIRNSNRTKRARSPFFYDKTFRGRTTERCYHFYLNRCIIHTKYQALHIKH